MVPYSGFSAHLEDLRWSFKASSIIDTILCSKPFLRYHSYLLNRFPGVDVGILDHGTGDEVFCFMDVKNGCLIKGFDHESDMSPHARDEFETWPGIFDEVPLELLGYLNEPEFHKDETTFCIWRQATDKHWWQGTVEESEKGEWSSHLLKYIFLNAASYLDWAREYYNNKVLTTEHVTNIFNTCNVDQASVLSINPKADLEMVKCELAAMGVTLT